MTGGKILRTDALEIFTATMSQIDVESVVKRQLQLEDDNLIIGEETIHLKPVSRIIVIGIGKASLAMARAVENLLNTRLDDGLVATNAIAGERLRRLEVILGGHPIPNDDSLRAARQALELLQRYDDEATLIIFLITGGGSAVFEQPIDASIGLEDLQEVNRVLVSCGAVISEMNIVRRHLSAVKGGRLAEAAPRSRQVSLYISDVNDDDLTSVASGPTLPSEATLDDFQRVIDKYSLLETLPPSVIALIRENRIPSLPSSTPDARRSHHLLLDNRDALETARDIAMQLGFAVEVAADLVEGDVSDLVAAHLTRLEDLRQKSPGRSVCLISGGEAVCPVRGTGRGGRNQEFVLRAALNLDAQAGTDVVVLSAGTDGIDGNSPATGAIADATTVPSAEAHGLSPVACLDNSDSYGFFAAVGGTIVTGPTGNNVRDLRVLLRR